MLRKIIVNLFCFAIILYIASGILNTFAGRPDIELQVKDDAFVISSSKQGGQWAIDDITTLDIRNQLPNSISKIEGTSIWNSRIGQDQVSTIDGKEDYHVIFFLSEDSSPFITIELTSQTLIFLNQDSEAETLEWYNELRKAMNDTAS
ncbi:hypothetical protein M3202_13805 [Alkalihalobacillus oceani]|uniref:Uncharacterized protein n=1 Tax=Halalkalibacter oceani TaxID=1653776 RepID=A0A9X2INQ8_9BACI|nr:hypothetical protein [Halalkalibacter oceani]MCM3715159.1 hypothetical protein [Halalkalibacter oceani]